MVDPRDEQRKEQAERISKAVAKEKATLAEIKSLLREERMKKEAMGTAGIVEGATAEDYKRWGIEPGAGQLGRTGKEFAGAFTNIPEKAGQVYKGVPKGKEFSPSAQPELWQYRPDMDIKTVKQTQEKAPWTPPPPPHGKVGQYMGPTYADRPRFEQHVFTKIGYNPYDINPTEETKKAHKNLPQKFDDVFRGKVFWDERHKMTKDQRDYWEAAKNEYLAHMYDRAKAKRETGMSKYNFMMQQFDNQAKQYEANMKKYEERMKEWRESRKYVSETGKWEEKPPKEVGKLTENQVIKELLNLSLSIEPTDKTITPEEIYAELYNRYRELVIGGEKRESAYRQVINEYGAISEKERAKPKTTTKKGYSHLWKR